MRTRFFSLSANRLFMLSVILFLFNGVVAKPIDNVTAPVNVVDATDSINMGVDVITQPEFRGGMEKLYQYIADNFEYPENAAKRSVNGQIEVEFTIEKSGDVTYVGILKGLDYSIDDEILRLFKAMPRWIPATKNGEKIRYKVSMPVTIRASRSKKSSSALRDYREQ